MVAAIAAEFKMMKLRRGGAQIKESGCVERPGPSQVDEPARLDKTISRVWKIFPENDIADC